MSQDFFDIQSGIYIMQNTMVRGRGGKNRQLGKKIKIRS